MLLKSIRNFKSSNVYGGTYNICAVVWIGSFKMVGWRWFLITLLISIRQFESSNVYGGTYICHRMDW